MRVTVYCASSAKAPPHFGEAAYALGELLARERVTVVYGGGGVGSMGRLADGVLAAGGEIIGIMPHFMRELEWGHPRVPTFVFTHTMAERKTKLMEATDAIVALPGGCGTFEELMEVVTLKRLGLFLKPIILLNQRGYYDALLALFERSVEEKFMDERHLAMYSVVEAVEGVLPAIRTATPWTSEARSFAVPK